MGSPAAPCLKLHLLCQYPQRPMAFAPHGWKALLPLRFLGIKYETIYVTLAQLRQELPTRFKLSKVTLPALIITDHEGQDTVILDSYNIAQFLETNYGRPERSIFRGESGRHFSRFIEQWVDQSLATAIRLCVLHTSYAQFPLDGNLGDPASRAAFLAKCGQARMDELTAFNSQPDWTAQRYAEVRKDLSLIERLLQDRNDRKESGAFLGGVWPIHADFCVYAFYPYSRTNKELVEQTWHHSSLPHVRHWLGQMQALQLVCETELPAL